MTTPYRAQIDQVLHCARLVAWPPRRQQYRAGNRPKGSHRSRVMVPAPLVWALRKAIRAFEEEHGG